MTIAAPYPGQVTSPSPLSASARRLRMVNATDSAQGTMPSFEEFYAANVRGVTVQIYAYFGNLADAQDVVQEAFCRAYPRWHKLAGYDDPVAWVRRVAWNLATSKWRRMRTAMRFVHRQREEHIPGPGPDHVALTAALATLPERQRRAVVLHYLADRSVAEIARDQGVAEGTVKSWLHRARAALADQLRDTDRHHGTRRPRGPERAPDTGRARPTQRTRDTERTRRAENRPRGTGHTPAETAERSRTTEQSRTTQQSHTTAAEGRGGAR